ncbi:MAG TPA: glycosyltransferase WbuB [Lentisphaeria bacterium]|nr:MAG: hypothetical protein A2X45_06255 [Lentisphaerae bacterium GWF2_50_93]HCE42094.1 glycosyltransferase WbuB [Lentisphaeria bacterium]
MNKQAESKHILFLTHYFPPEGNAPASRVYEMAKCWIKDGQRVTVITGVPNVPDGIVYEGYKNRLYQKETIDGITVIRVWTYIAANKGTLRRIMNYLSYMSSSVLAGLFVRSPDVVIATSPQFFCGWAGVILSKLRRRRFILEIRDIWPDSIIAVGTSMPKLLIKMLEVLEILMYKAADTIVTVGDGYKDQLTAKKVHAGKIAVITNGADTAIFKPSPRNQAVISQYGLMDKFVCSYVGTIGMACGLDIVIDAAEKLRAGNNGRIAFLLVGDGARRHELEQLAKDRKLNNVIFTGRLPKEDIPSILSASDANLIHLIKNDLFKSVLPSKIFEAAAMKNPIIIGVQGYAADFVRTIEAGICIEPGNSDELLDALEKISGDGELAERMGQKGYENIIRHYTRESLAKKYLEIINQ